MRDSLLLAAQHAGRFFPGPLRRWAGRVLCLDRQANANRAVAAGTPLSELASLDLTSGAAVCRT